MSFIRDLGDKFLKYNPLTAIPYRAADYAVNNPDKVGEFLFGSDPGAKPREALSKFGMTGEIGGVDQTELLNSILGSEKESNTMAASQRLSRAGLIGSGKAENTFRGIQMDSAENLRKARMSLLDRQLRALGIAAGQPREKGLVESAAPIAMSFLG